MKLVISRFIAILILVIPGLMAMTGFLFMKDAVFAFYSVHGDASVAHPSFEWGHFLLGLLLFLLRHDVSWRMDFVPGPQAELRWTKV